MAEQIDEKNDELELLRRELESMVRLKDRELLAARSEYAQLLASFKPKKTSSTVST